MTLTRGNRSSGSKTSHGATSSTTDLTRTDLAANPGFSGERPVTDLEDKPYLQSILKYAVRTSQ